MKNNTARPLAGPLAFGLTTRPVYRGGGSGGLKFLALTADSSDFAAVDIKTGIAPLTSTHASTIYQPDNDGLYHAFGANAPLIRGGRKSGGTWFLDGAGDGVLTGYYWVQPAITNSCLNSNDLTGAAWSTSGTITRTQDQTGLTGGATGATYLEDTDATTAANAFQSFVVAADTSEHTIRAFVAYEDDETTFPELLLTLQGGTNLQGSLGINRKTGATIWRVNSSSAYSVTVARVGPWWELLVTGVNNGTNTALVVRVAPAIESSWGVLDVTATGHCIVGNMEAYIGYSTESVAGAGPIFTTTGAVATDAALISFDVANMGLGVDGVMAAEIYSPLDWDQYLNVPQKWIDPNSGANNPSPFFLQEHATNGGYASSVDADGVSVDGSTGLTGSEYSVGVAYSEAEDKRKLAVDGSLTSEVAFGGWGAVDRTFQLGGLSSAPFGIRNLQRWDLAYVDSLVKLAELTG